MSRRTLTIKLQSPLATGTGREGPGGIDRDAVFDEFGLPEIPGRRLKGLLRDAYRDLLDLAGSTPAGWPTVEALFGVPGAEQPGAVRVGTARLADAQVLRDWLGAPATQIAAEEVREYYGEVRNQTAIDDVTGTAADHSLRRRRAIRAGLTLRANIELAADKAHWWPALDGAVRSLRRAGTSRTRGFGEIRCRLDHAPSCLDDQQAGLRAIGAPKVAAPSAVAASGGDLTDTSAGDARVSVWYKITLRDDVLLAVPGGDPNTVRTETHISGATVRGAVAARLLGDPAFDAVVRGACWRFHDALPLEGARIAVPVRGSLRRIKVPDAGESEWLDTLATDSFKQSLKRVGGYTTLQGDVRWAGTPTTTLSLHHARAVDRRVGRAKQDDGHLFQYEALRAGATFCGRIEAPAGEVGKVKDALSGDIRIGRSRSAQYGRAFIELVDQAPAWGDMAPTDGTVVRAVDGQATTFETILYCRSDLAARNEQGHPAAVWPLHELAARLTAALNTEVTIEAPEKSYLRPRIRTGHAGHLGLPRPQRAVIQSGSLCRLRIVVDTTVEKLNSTLSAIAAEGLGDDRELGLGDVVFLDQAALVEGKKSVEPSKTAQDAPPLPVPDEAKPIVAHIRRRKLLKDAANAGLGAVKAGAGSKSTLARVRLALRQNPSLKELAAWANELKEPAQKSLRDVQMDSGDHRKNLLELLLNAPNQAAALAESLNAANGDPELQSDLFYAFLRAVLHKAMKGDRTGNKTGGRE